MRKYLFIFTVCSLLYSCRQEKQEPLEPEPPVEDPYTIPCGCGDEWPEEIMTCDRELPWDYPVKIGTEEWKQYNSYQEIVKVCQIPTDLLTSLSTDDLTDLCMQSPLLMSEIFGGMQDYSYDKALDSLFKNFNGVRELVQREDVVNGLLNWYKCAMQNLSFLKGEASDVEKGFFLLRIAAATLLLNRCQSPDNANKEKYVEIVQHLVCGYEKIYAYVKPFVGDYALVASCYTRAKILIKMDEQNLEKIPQGYSNLLFTKGWIDDQTRSAIDELSCQFIH